MHLFRPSTLRRRGFFVAVVPFGSAAFFLPISLRRVLWGISQNRPNGRKTRRKDEQEKVINRL
jgi:hypothetical protein